MLSLANMLLNTLIWVTIALIPALSEACDKWSVYHQFSPSNCPLELPNPVRYPVMSESECLLLCTLTPDCQMSVYIIETATCYTVDFGVSMGTCSSAMVVRRKINAPEGDPISNLPATTAQSGFSTTIKSVQSSDTTSYAQSAATTTKFGTTSAPTVGTLSLSDLSFASSVLLFYNFKKSYLNMVDNWSHTALPQNVVSQDSTGGVKLAGSPNSYVQVLTTGFFENFKLGKRFSIFFKGKFGIDNINSKCISSFSPDGSSAYMSSVYINKDGGINSLAYRVDGSNREATIKSQDAISTGSNLRVRSIGVRFDGTSFTNCFMDGALVNTDNTGSSGGGPVATNSYDILRIGTCLTTSGYKQFDGWLHCWGFANRSLSVSELNSLSSLCDA